LRQSHKKDFPVIFLNIELYIFLERLKLQFHGQVISFFYILIFKIDQKPETESRKVGCLKMWTVKTLKNVFVVGNLITLTNLRLLKSQILRQMALPWEHLIFTFAFNNYCINIIDLSVLSPIRYAVPHKFSWRTLNQ
jgi:hypothetical protein